jgi:uncharacterized protein (UPF0147 family)
METNTVNDAIVNIAATSSMLEKISNDPNKKISPYAAQLLEQMSWELGRLAGDLSEINYYYVS